MQKTFTTFLEKLCFNVFKDNYLAFFVLNKLGRITQWGGNLSGLNMTEPSENDDISDVAIFMEGILPLKSDSMEFSCIKMSNNACIDALLFKIGIGYGLIIWDATQKNRYLTETQQKCNELSLLIEAQKNRIVRSPHAQGSSESLLDGLFQALNLAVLEMDDNGHFILIGSPPKWIEQIPQSSQILTGQAYKEDAFTFLGNFIQTAKNLWAKNHQGSYNSGVWIERDETGQEYLFEATAVDIQGRKLLIISHDRCYPYEKQSIIQKGRDLALNYDRLKRSDKELKDMHDELEQSVKERTIDLQEANRKLANELQERKKVEKEREEVSRQLRQSQKMEAIGTLAGGIAHDFNNILSAIIGFSELSLVETGENAKLKSMLEKILHASDRAKDLVRQILTFSHQTEFEKKPLKLNLVVVEVLNLLRASLPSFIEIKKDLNSNAFILADQTQIHQVIMNLCTNAWHAMKENGGTLTVGLKEIHLTKENLSPNTDLPPGQYIELMIKDTGSGIRPEIIERIFDPYFTTKDPDKGTGLGLSVVHGIITSCKGSIKVSSQIREGSTFTIYLPIFDAPVLSKSTPETLHFGNNEKILFVDDEPFQTELGEELLQHMGYQVTTSNDSIHALQLFLENKDDFDLVITDSIMPKMTGSVLAEKILDVKPDMPVILCSGYSELIDSDSFSQTGITQYLMKPISMNDLSTAVKQALGKNRK